MERKTIWVVASCFMIVAMLLVSCTSAVPDSEVTGRGGSSTRGTRGGD
jgi:hypothetical protein